MKGESQFGGQVMGIPLVAASISYPKGKLSSLFSKEAEDSVKYWRKGSVLQRMNKLGKKADVFAKGIREHVRLSPKISETVKGKLSLGSRILQMGGMDKVFKTLFNASEKERLLTASQCYISTSAGPIGGLLFISSQNVAFCSERSLKMSSPTGKPLRVHYKVLIPLTRVENARESENVKRPSQKYLQIVTVDDFEFWFIGFLNYQKTWRHLQQAISQSQANTRHLNH